MKIVVCLKQVPDTSEVKIDPVTGTLIRDGIPSIINPDDKSGLEAALQLKDSMQAEVTVLTMGPPQAENALREALAMGADKAVLLTDRVFGGADTWATSSTLAAALRRLEWDLVICGRQAIDGDTAQVGPQIAEHLQIPHVSYVSELRAEAGAFELKRSFEDGYQKLRVRPPCLLTVLKELQRPRYMSVSGIYDACRADLTLWNASDLGLDAAAVGLKGSPTRVKASFTKSARSTGCVHEVDPKEGARIIIEKLQEKFIIRA